MPHEFGTTDSQVGVTGTSNTAAGLVGRSVNEHGVFGQSQSSRGIGGISQSDVGVFGVSQTGEGVHGETQSATFAAVAGIQLNPNGTGAGVFGASRGKGPAGFFAGDVSVTGDI